LSFQLDYADLICEFNSIKYKNYVIDMNKINNSKLSYFLFRLYS